MATVTQFAAGLHGARVDNASISGIAAALDPAFGYVIVECHHPAGESRAWAEAMVALSPPGLLAPERRRVRRVSFDVLMTTSDFVDAAAEIDAASPGTINLWQMAAAPPPTLGILSQLSDPARLAVRGGVYRANRIVLSAELNEGRLLATGPDPRALQAFIDRLEAGSAPPPPG